MPATAPVKLDRIPFTRMRRHSASAVEEAIALHRKGLAANRDGDTRGALGLFLQANALHPQRVPYLLSAANMWLKLGQAEPALALYRQLADMELTEAYAKMVSEKSAAAEKMIEEQAPPPPLPGGRARAMTEGASPPRSLNSSLSSTASVQMEGTLRVERAPTASEAAAPAPPPRGPSKLPDGASAPDLEGLLGRGSYGVVWRGRDRVHGPVAVKIVPTDGSGGSDGGNGDADGELADEIDLLTRAEHLNVIAFHAAFIHRQARCGS